MQRYFAKEKNKNKFILNNDDLRHIKVVMRMNVNDKIIVVYKEESYLCNINKNYEIKIIEKLENISDIVPKVSLIVPVLKEQKLDYILQKSTELGVDEIILYYSNRGVIKENEKVLKKLERWQKILKEASEQSHRLNIPSLKISKLEEIELKEINLVCSTLEKSNFIKNTLKTINICDKINVVIGPEGGLDKKEEELLINKGFIPVTLGSRILRVETVPLFIMSIINYEFME